MFQGFAPACVFERLAPSRYACANSFGLAAADRQVRYAAAASYRPVEDGAVTENWTA
jgi:hypothetical protein